MEGVNGSRLMSDFNFTSKYARYNQEAGRRETWEESVDRMFDMHARKYGHLWAENADIANEFDYARQWVKEKKLLGSQRALQFGGKGVEKHNMRIYNCLSRDTQFITSHGVKSFEDFEDGETLTVPTHKNLVREAVVRSYGKQRLRKVLLKRKKAVHEVWATDNHRWLLTDGSCTTNLSEGDKILGAPNMAAGFDDYDSMDPESKLYWCYGYVFGDGTRVKDKSGAHRWSMVRLCGSDIQYKYRFEEMGFKTSSSDSLDGDFMAYTGTYLKTIPDPAVDPLWKIKAWVQGYLAADGEKNLNYGRTSQNMYHTIQATGEESVEAIRKLFPLAGFYLVSETDLTGQEANYGIRPFTIKFRVANTFGPNNVFTAFPTSETKVENVWCLEVEEDQSFLLPFGAVTGNCAVSYCDRPKFFAECFYMLLCGCGTGFSVQKHHVDQLPPLSRFNNDISKRYHVEDTIEGWADALDTLINAYFTNDPVPEFDLNKIRPRGAQLSTGGTAPGPEPLQNALIKIHAILEEAVLSDKERLSPIECYDIVMHASDAVLAGGVRRSATIALFSPDDEEMVNAKTGNWFVENPQRGRSNNSAVLVRGDDNLEEFKTLMKTLRDFGEPGFIFVDSKEYIYNPCVEIGMCPVLISDSNGEILDEYSTDLLDFSKRNHWLEQGYTFESGWQCCNLTEMNASVWKDPVEAVKTAHYAAIVGTLQAGYTEPGYLTEVSQKIIEREALLGVSMTGMMDNESIAFNPRIQREMANRVVRTNKGWAAMLGIRQAARTTCVKPAGNSSVLLSDEYYVASGIHPHHAHRLFRLVQVHKDDPVAQWFRQHNPHLIQESVWSANKTDDVITFPIVTRPGARVKDDFHPEDFLDKVRETQQNWVLPGAARPLSCQGLSHNVSNTCEVGPKEWSSVGRYIYDNQQWFSGLSLLGKSGDFMYQQAPMQRVIFEEELADMFGAANVGAAKHMRRHIERRYRSIYNVMTPLKMVLEGYSTEKAVEGTDIHPELLWETYKKIRAVIHVEETDDILLLLASIGDEEKWNRLNKLMIPVDYTLLYEEQDLTKALDNVACGGGVCEIDFSISPSPNS